MTNHPAEVYRWLRESELEDAAAVTVCTGMAQADALLAFGADPTSPRPAEEAEDTIDPHVRTLDIAGGATLAVEYNGWQGSRSEVLTRLSARGLAASMYWNVDALTNFAAARGGRVLASYEPFSDEPPEATDPDVLAALDGLDFDSTHHSKSACGLVAVERLTGVRFGPEHWAEMEDDDVVYPILPWLSELHPARTPDGVLHPSGRNPLGSDVVRLAALPAEVLGDLAWDGARSVAERTGLLADEEAARRSIAERGLTADAELLARASTIGDWPHVVGWRALHRATNPDPVAAAMAVLAEVGTVLGEEGLAPARRLLAAG
jgi:hypothetical protein